MSNIEFEFVEEDKIVKHKYGFLPVSVQELDYDEKYRMLEISDVGVKRTIAIGAENFANSRFNPAVAERVIKYWSNVGDLVLDPFMGYGMRGFVARQLCRNYLGYEVSPKTFEQVKEKLNMQKLVEQNWKMNIMLSNGCHLKEVPDESVDMIFTCPPYWNIEEYESVQGQLSDCKSYNVFLEFINICLTNCFRTLKKGKFMVWVIADFRLDKKYYCFHKDLIVLCEKNRFALHDIIINVLRTPFAFAAPLQNERFRTTQKKHEYILVFKK